MCRPHSNFLFTYYIQSKFHAISILGRVLFRNFTCFHGSVIKYLLEHDHSNIFYLLATSFNYQNTTISSDCLLIKLKELDPQKTIATPQQFVFPCEKRRGSPNSSFHFFSSFNEECVSCNKTNPLWFILCLRSKYFYSFVRGLYSPNII